MDLNFFQVLQNCFPPPGLLQLLFPLHLLFLLPGRLNSLVGSFALFLSLYKRHSLRVVSLTHTFYSLPPLWLPRILFLSFPPTARVGSQRKDRCWGGLYQEFCQYMKHLWKLRRENTLFSVHPRFFQDSGLDRKRGLSRLGFPHGLCSLPATLWSLGACPSQDRDTDHTIRLQVGNLVSNNSSLPFSAV